MRRRLLRLGVVAFAVWALVAGVFLIRAASDLKAGRNAANRARLNLGAQDVADRVPLPHLRTAAKRFSSAHGRVHNKVVAPLRILPVIGRQLRSVDALSGAAARIADVGASAIDRAANVIDNPADAGPARVAQVRTLSGIVDDVATRLASIDDLGPNVALVGPLAQARAQLVDELEKARSELADARAGAKAALALVEGPRRYLVVAANNAEMRAGSGMWLQGGLLETQEGRLRLEPLVALANDAKPPPGQVKPGGALGDLWSFLEPGNEWRSLMASPSFEDSARAAAAMWEATGRGAVDGVLAVDAVGLQAIVQATGPIQVGNRALAADGVLGYVLHDQYHEFSDVDAGSIQNAARREAIGALARAAVDSVDRGSYRPSVLLRSLGDAVKGRHLLAWSARKEELAGWRAAGMDGALQPRSLLVSLLNIGANKLDWFMRVDATLRRVRTDNGSDVAVELKIANRTPSKDEPRYVVGPEPGSGHIVGEYLGIVAVNVPERAQNIRFDGGKRLAIAGTDGSSRVVGFPLSIPGGESRTVVLRFSLPRAVDSMRIEPSARVPPVRWRYGSSSWEDSAARTANVDG